MTRRSLKWGFTYRIGVHIIPDSFCAGAKTIPDRASVRRDFCNGAKLPRAYLESGESDTG